MFNSHLEETVEMAPTAPEEVALWARRAGRTVEQHTALVAGMMAGEKEVPRQLCRLADPFDRLGVRYGNHDDPDGETRET